MLLFICLTTINRFQVTDFKTFSLLSSISTISFKGIAPNNRNNQLFILCKSRTSPRYFSTILGQNSKKKDNLGFVVTPSRHMASKRRKQYTGWPIFLTITTILAHFSWLLRLGFVTRGIALRHGTLPLFDATKCRLCLRRLLRGFFLVIRGNSPEMQEQSRANEEWNRKLFFSFLLIT